MKVKEFIRFSHTPELAIKQLSLEIHEFLKKDKTIEVINLSHSLIESKLTDGEHFIASALLCYK
jgi:hypothetical protein